MDRQVLGKWTLKLQCFLLSIAVLSLLVGETAEVEQDGDTTKSTSNQQTCNMYRSPHSDQHRFYMLVSTLDGKVTALDMEKGRPVWSVATGSRHLISSSISKLEINRNGVPTKLIPSLDGGLYQFDGDGMEPVPLAADLMLSSSFRFNDNSIVVGGKEKETYGIDLASGKVKYVCSASGCEYFDNDNKNENVQQGERVLANGATEEVLVITRHTKTVRAVEMKTGQEKWNFSVGTHDITYIRSSGPSDDVRHIEQESKADESGDECVVEGEDSFDFSWLYEKIGAQNTDDIDFKVIVPKGLVTAFNKWDPDKVLWEYKFDTAIADAWTLSESDLSEVSLFDDKHIPALTVEGNPEDHSPSDTPQPMLYIGVHEKQLYVQPSVQMTHEVREATSEAMQSGSLIEASMPYITWRPYLATSTSRTPIMMNQKPPPQLTWEREQEPIEEKNLAMWHKNYPYDEGYYLFTDSETVNVRENKPDNTNYIYNGFTDDITITLWNWWREVLAIAVVTAVVTSYITAHLAEMRFRYFGRSRNVAEGISTDTSQSKSADMSNRAGDSVEDAKEAPVEYVSRYFTDFEQDTCLGRGGFGVVFQARNKLDDCEYAIKRITLNDSEKAREKVMREVKALAKLEHTGIVRYYQAWLETPPIGWQEEKDKTLLDMSTTSPGFSITEYTPTNHPYVKTSLISSGINPLSVAGDLNPLRPSDVQEESGASGATEPSQPDVQRVGSSEGFVPHSDGSLNDFDEESESFSAFGSNNKWLKEDSFDVVFQNSESDTSTEVSSDSKSFPFGSYGGKQALDNTTNSLDIVFEDSGCPEKSKSEECWAQEDKSYAIIDCSVGQTGAAKESDEFFGSQGASAEEHSNANIVASIESGTSPPTRPGSLNLAKQYTREGGKAKYANQPKLYLYIQMQLCQRESLKDWLNNNCQNRDKEQLVDIFIQIVSAVEYVHDMGLMHRDLKPSNIFFSMDGQVKIGDFGLVTALEDNIEYTPVCDNPAGYYKHTDQVGTKLYMSPEQVDDAEGRVYTHKVDIYALGVIFVELFCPFSTQMERVRTLVEVRRLLFPTKFVKDFPDESTFVKPLLSPNPDERPSANNILQNRLLGHLQQNTSYLTSGVRQRTRSRTRTISSSSSCASSLPNN